MKKLLILLLVVAAGMFSCGDKEQKVRISTEQGDIVIKLYNETPQHRDNFIKLVKEGYYDGSLFHRVIKEFMIQGGDPDSKTAKPGARLGSGGPGYTVPAEFVPQYFHKKGAVAAARKGDAQNPAKASSGCQFYLVQGKKYTEAELDKMENGIGANISAERRKAYSTVGGTPFLDDKYTVFGEIVEGLDVMDKIALAATDRSDRPTEDIKMTLTLEK